MSLTRLVLRGGEAAKIRLEDIDWHAGQVAILSKGGRRFVLPLPADIGEAWAHYLLTVRPKTNTTTLFVTGKAPFTALAVASVTMVLARACSRAGVARFGSASHPARRSLWPAAGRSVDGGDRPVAPTCSGAHHRDLRKGRPAAARPTGQALPAGGGAMSDHDAAAGRGLPGDAPHPGIHPGCRGACAAGFRRPARAGRPAHGRGRAGLGLLNRDLLDPPGASAQDRTRVHRHLHALDPACEIPSPGLLPIRTRRPRPFIYADTEIAALIHATGTITAPLFSATMKALISPIASTGLRLGEALGLDRAEIDTETTTLTVTGKGKTRLVPVHPTTATMLEQYAAHRDRLCRLARADSFFLTAGGHRRLQRGIQEAFARLLTLAEIETPPGHRRPRIHDLRHTFAVKTLIDWQRDGVDVAAHLPVLSTYLGRSSPMATYWYLNATPELLGLAAQRLDLAQERP